MWVPAAEAHAIERVTLTFFFADAMSSKLVLKALEPMNKLLSDGVFRAKKELSHSNIRVNASRPNDVAHSSEVVGASFYYDELGSDEALQCTREFVLFSASKYGTWSGFRSAAFEALDVILPKFLEATSIRAAKLEYADRFVFEGDSREARVDEVLKRDAINIPANALDLGDPWHNRRGWFLRNGDSKILVNLDISQVEVSHVERPNKPLISVQINTVLEWRLAAYIDSIDTLKSMTDTLHTESKTVTRSALTDRAAQMIGLSDAG